MLLTPDTFEIGNKCVLFFLTANSDQLTISKV